MSPPVPGYGTAPPAPGYSATPLPSAGYWMPPPAPSYMAIALTPSPGLRIFLLVVLAISGLFSGLFSLAGLSGVISGSEGTGEFFFFAFFTSVFAFQVLAFVGVAIRARWSGWVAMIAGIGMMLTVLGIPLAIPIWIAAARAPDLTKKGAVP